jgi:hypothetical protein
MATRETHLDLIRLTLKGDATCWRIAAVLSASYYPDPRVGMGGVSIFGSVG